MSKTTKSNVSVLNAIRQSKGRFFGIYTKQGEAINARFYDETPSYMVIYDRNSDNYRRIAKTSLVGVRISSQTIGHTV